MEDILDKLSKEEASQYDLYKIQAINETLDEVSEDPNKYDIVYMTNLFNEKLKMNRSFVTIVENYVNKYIPEDKIEDAKEELYMILSGEILSIFKGFNQAKCNIL